jgi:hypothetical protein
MDELEFARINLVQKQENLRMFRKNWGLQTTGYNHPSWHNTHFKMEDDVKCALSRLWDLQNDRK